MHLDGYDSGDEGAQPDFSQEGLEALIAELEARLQHIIKLEGVIEELTAQIRQLQLQLEASILANQELMDEVGSLQTSKTRLEHDLEVLQSKMLLLQENMKTLEMEIKSLKRIQKRNERTIQQQKATIDQLRKLLEAYQSTGVNTVGGDYVNDPSLVKRFKEMEQEINSLLSEIADLQAQLDKERDFFRKRFLKKWGENTTDCNGCGLEFSVMLRRHHCRLCGGVFCSQCCNDRVQTSASRRPVRVCHDCNEFLLKIEEEDQEKLRIKSEAVATYGELHEVVIEKSVSSEPLGMEVVFDFETTQDGKELTAELIRVAPDGLASRSGVRTKDIILRIGSAAVADMTSRADAAVAMATNPLRLWIKSQSSNLPTTEVSSKRWIEDIKRRVRSNTTLSGQSPIGSPILNRKSPMPASPPSVYSTPLGAPIPNITKALAGRDSPSRLAQSTTVHASKPPIKPMPRLSVSDEVEEDEDRSPKMTTSVAAAKSALKTETKQAESSPVDKTEPVGSAETKAVTTPKVQSAAESAPSSPKRNGAKGKAKPGNPFATSPKAKSKPINPFDEIKRGSKSAPTSSANLTLSNVELPSVPTTEPSAPSKPPKKRLPSDLFD
jgi:membrane-associated protease RseP (regulator of RpoE activity)